MKSVASPYYLESQESLGRQLERHEVEANEERSESWIQGLLYQHPDLLPIGEFGSSYGPLIPLGREIPTASGPIDLLYVSPEGMLTMVETKLWKNPEKHRTVAAQVIDYAKELASWGYDELCSRVLEASRVRESPNPRSLEDRVVPVLKAAGEELHPFQEALVENLARGRFLVLIAGDRVSPNLVLLSQAIQAAPGLEFTIGLVELRLYRLNSQNPWPLIVVPGVVGRSVEVTRGVIRVQYETERPRLQIEAEPEEKTATRLDLDDLLGSVPGDLAAAFRAGVAKWQSAGGQLRSTSKRLFLEGEVDGALQKFVRLQPAKMNVITQSDFARMSTDASLYSRYLDALEHSPQAANAARSDRMWLRYSELEPADVQVIIDAAIDLFQQV